jgi:hypothetical protein
VILAAQCLSLRTLFSPSGSGSNQSVTSLGSAIFAFLAAGTFKMSRTRKTRSARRTASTTPTPSERPVYEELYGLFSRLYFAFGKGNGEMGPVLAGLIHVAETHNRSQARPPVHCDATRLETSVTK